MQLPYVYYTSDICVQKTDMLSLFIWDFPWKFSLCKTLENVIDLTHSLHLNTNKV